MVQLKDNDGKWVEGKDGIRDLLMKYFSELFSSSSHSDGNKVVDNIDVCLSPVEISELDEPVTSSEIWNTLN